MGDRATIEVIGAPAYIYVHWHGAAETVEEVVRTAAPVMRKGDPNYALARLIGEFHVFIPGGLSLGVVPADESYREKWDNGHYKIDMSKGLLSRTHLTFEDDETEVTEVIARDIEFGQF